MASRGLYLGSMIFSRFFPAAVVFFIFLGTPEAAEKIQVFLLSGQSNMSGGGKLDGPLEAVDAVDGKVRIWDGCAYWAKKNAYPKKWVSLTEVQELKKKLGRNWIGPEFGFSREIAKDISAEKIYLIKVACGGTAIDWWLPKDKDVADRYQWHSRLVSNIDEALKAIPGEYEIAGMLWMQGETDTMRKNMAESYQKNLEELISIMRTKFKEPQLPVVVGRITSQLLKSKKYQWPFTTTVQAAQDAVAKKDGKVEVVNSDDLSLRTDFTHFDVPGQMKLGERFGVAMRKVLKGE